jgi:DNA-binding response OmpR family regulator
MRILIVEDDNRIAQNIKLFLKNSSYSVDIANTGKEGTSKAKVEEYDLIILDWMLGDTTGPDVCKELRASEIKTPILFLTAKSQLEDKIDAFEIGADDYLTKPFHAEELLVRVKALIRRSYTETSSPIVKLGDLEIDTNSAVVTRDGQLIELSPKLFSILEYLALNHDKIVSRTEILEHVWDENANYFNNTVDVHIRYLRKKIDDPFPTQLIKTVKGKGYMLCSQ